MSLLDIQLPRTTLEKRLLTNADGIRVTNDINNQHTNTQRLVTVGGERFTVDPRRSCGPILECRRIGNPPPGVPPGELAHEGAMRILGVINVLSESRRLGNALLTFR